MDDNYVSAGARHVSSGRNAGIAVRAENADSGANSTRRQQLAGYVLSVILSELVPFAAIRGFVGSGMGLGL
jgi:hypothetical protein